MLLLSFSEYGPVLFFLELLAKCVDCVTSTIVDTSAAKKLTVVATHKRVNSVIILSQSCLAT